jgi:hypothetical protein
LSLIQFLATRVCRSVTRGGRGVPGHPLRLGRTKGAIPLANECESWASGL